MSCSICLLPFIPNLRRATSPLPEHTPPGSVVPKATASYFMSADGIGHKIMGCVQRFHYYSFNMFGSVTGVELVTWESSDGASAGTFFMAHHVCLALLRHALKVEDDTLESKITLCAHEIILGRPQGGATAGRLKGIDYKRNGVDLSPFWHRGADLGHNVFDWTALKSHENGSLAWLIQRPDIFPRFSQKMSPERLASLGPPLPEAERRDRITIMPLELILHLLPYLSPEAFVSLMSTCRFLRYHAFTTFQSHARDLVLKLPWALPTRCEVRRINAEFLAEMATDDEALRGGDWYLYLNQVHWTKSMRVRRWIWSLCEEIERVWTKNLGKSGYADLGDGVKSKARIQLEKQVKEKIRQEEYMLMMNKGAKAAN